MMDALKINTWVLDKNLEGTGYWAYDNTVFEHGYWVSEKSDKQLDADDVFKFDGIVEVETEIPDDGRVRLAYSSEYPSEPRFDALTVGNNVRALAPININVCPSDDKIVAQCTKTDREYYLNIKTYKLDGTEVISARLKLVVLEDKTFTPEKYNIPVYTSGEEWSRFLSIELVSYEYNDMYKLS